jgi:choline dehydrogenase
MNASTEDAYDYVVVGAGSAGCALAGELACHGDASVLLLEAGPPNRRREMAIPAAFPSLLGTECDWAFESEPEDGLGGRRVPVPRGRTLGGCSSISAQIYFRGNRLDFDGWEGAGATGWSYGDVLPWFRRTERNERGADEVHGEDGPVWVSDLRDANPLTLAFVGAAVEAGVPQCADLNGPEPEGVALVQVTQRRGRRWSAADAYLGRARRGRRLRVVTGAHAVRVVLERGGATGVDYLVEGRQRTARAKREVLVSAGAVGSPQLLLRSGIGPTDQLEQLGIEVVHDLPGVGRNLQDHPAVPVLHATRLPVSHLGARSPRELAQYAVRRRGLLTSNIGEAIALVRTQPGAEAPDVEIAFGPVLVPGPGYRGPAGHGFTMLVAALAPRSRGEVTLRSPDPLAPPAIRLGLLSDPVGEDLRVLADGILLARRIGATLSSQGVSTGELDPGADVVTRAAIEVWTTRRVHTFHHLAGTCRMGQDALAVVDPELRVHGLDRLRVVDASVMPRVPRAHTNAAAIMIGHRAAHLISSGVGIRSSAPEGRPVRSTPVRSDNRGQPARGVDHEQGRYR